MSGSKPQLLMRRPRLDRLPPLAVPPDGCEIRMAAASDEEELAHLLTLAFPEEPWDTSRVRRDLTRAEDVEQVFVIETDGAMVATASSRRLPDRFPDSGYVHWVAAHPAHSGKGLGRAITLSILRFMREKGRTDAVLETDDSRLAAIRTYLNLGFLPEDTHPGDLDRWSRIFDKLERFRSGKR
jgi:mycothiol synthase